MIADKYRRISIWMLRVDIFVMSILSFFFFLFSVDVFRGVWEETLILVTMGIMGVVVLMALMFFIISLRQALINKEVRNSLITTSLIALANIPILAVFSIVILYIMLTGGIYQD